MITYQPCGVGLPNRGLASQSPVFWFLHLQFRRIQCISKLYINKFTTSRAKIRKGWWVGAGAAMDISWDKYGQLLPRAITFFEKHLPPKITKSYSLEISVLLLSSGAWVVVPASPKISLQIFHSEILLMMFCTLICKSRFCSRGPREQCVWQCFEFWYWSECKWWSSRKV